MASAREEEDATALDAMALDAMAAAFRKRIAERLSELTGEGEAIAIGTRSPPPPW